MIWYKEVIEKLRACGLFTKVSLVGAKARASLDEVRFLDVHYDPTSQSYSYALIDLGLAYPGDKRLFGWDDYPHENVAAIRQLESYPHHFHTRAEDGNWLFERSPMRGDKGRRHVGVHFFQAAYGQRGYLAPRLVKRRLCFVRSLKGIFAPPALPAASAGDSPSTTPCCTPLAQAAAACWESRWRGERVVATGGEHEDAPGVLSGVALRKGRRYNAL